MELNNRYKYSTGTTADNEKIYEIFITPEIRAYQAKFADPLTLNFKIMIDWDKKSGLFADVENVDSALAYLKRIGDELRFNMLKYWIDVFKTFIKNYDFLILSCEGVDAIINAKPHEVFTENDKLSLTIRETSDMLIQSLLTQYRHIWFDDVRCVEVIPANLRRFDLSILIYSSGYYNMALYDVLNNVNGTTDNIQTKIFPTIKKLSDKYFFENAQTYDFNHHLVNLQDAQINNEDSGKSFFSSLSNEMSGDNVKNTMVFNYRFADYRGSFNNIFGQFDFTKLLALASAQNKLLNQVSNQTSTSQTTTNQQNKQTLSDRLKDFFGETKNEFVNNTTSTINLLKNKPSAYAQSLISPNTVIGNTFKNLTNPAYLPKLIKNTVDLGITKAENYLVYDNIAKLNNMVLKNFSDNFLGIYENWFGPKEVPNKATLFEDVQQRQDPNQKVDNNAKFGNENIYNRKSF
jgi:uncharacterized protein YqkB